VSDRVVVRIPASTAHVALVRAAASAVAVALDFTYDRITDLHIALDEVSSRIMATSARSACILEFVLEPDGKGLRVHAGGDAPSREGIAFLTDWSRAILGAVTDEMDVSLNGGRQSASFRVSNR